MKHYAMQNSMSLGDSARLPRKKARTTVKKIKLVRKDDQNDHLSHDLLVWGMLKQPAWIASITQTEVE